MDVPGQDPTGRKQPIDSTILSEGATAWADTTMLHAAAEHPNCA
jgi:putative spermidine/putrescine transport system substrate-binding protein